MPMLACLTPRPHKDTRSARGFTLLEVLTVLFIVGLVGAVVLPNFPVLLDGISSANKRDDVVRSINTLSYRALATNQNYVLAGTYESQNSISDEIANLDIFTNTSFRAHDITHVQIALPEGWKMHVSVPIFYRASGFCSGGSIELDTGLTTTSYTLTAPSCQLESR
jgi:prepilin-type N-terminal cleavage/methylation domain-containing protein